MNSDKQESISNFAREACSYAFEYATRKYPDKIPRRFTGRFGHAIDLLDAIRIRQLFVQNIQAAAANLTPDEIIEARDLAARQFKYNKRFVRAAGDMKPGDELITEAIVIEDYFDRAEVGGLLDEVVAIGLGNFDQAKSVGARFGMLMRPAPQPAFGGRMARYAGWLGN